MYVFLAILVAMVAVGFVAGAVLGVRVVSEAKAVEKRVRVSVAQAFLSTRDEISKLDEMVEAKRAKLEQDAKDSFKAFQDDVENIVKRLEALEHNQAVRVAEVISPNAPRA